ncbi:MAG TPA: signal peptidase I [Verrucomicrobiae bacterium]|nr:signal peptidase I [Verrucomicrobiae bacterium]
MRLGFTQDLEEPTAETSRQLPATGRRTGFFQILLKQIFSCIIVAGLAFASFQFITHYVLQTVQVVGASMTPTLHDSQRYVLNRWVYHVREPHTKEIVVLRDPLDNSYAIKRIVAQQGDSVHLKDGKIFVNGKLLEEPYLPPGTQTFPNPRYREQFLVCGTGKYFVLGDNRNNSSDSRFYGTVPRQNILGLVVP